MVLRSKNLRWPLAVGFTGGALAVSGVSFASIWNPDTPAVSGGFLAALLAALAVTVLPCWLLTVKNDLNLIRIGKVETSQDELETMALLALQQ